MELEYSEQAERNNQAEMVEIESQKIDKFLDDIADFKFDGGSFYAILLLSVVKDLIDIFSLGLGGTIANFFVVPTLVIISLLRGTRLKSKFIMKFILPMIIEFIPGIDILPSYTLTTLLLKVMADNRIRSLIVSLEEAKRHLGRIKTT